MSDEFKNIIRVASIYTTTIIGAGFASGQEIMQFFSVYKRGGFLGVLLAGILFSVVGCIVLDKVRTQRIRNYEEFLFPMVGWRLGWVLKIAVTLFMFCMFSIMIAGSGNVLTENLGIPLGYSTLIMGIICMLLMMTNIKGIVAFSTLITPFLVIGIILSGLYIIIFRDQQVLKSYVFLSHITNNWVLSSLLYVSYNSILSIAILCSMLPYVKTRKTAIAGGIMGGASLAVAAMVINAVLSLFYPLVLGKELPVMDILKGFSSFGGGFYAVIIWFAMLTSAVTSGYSFADRVSSTMKLDKRIMIVLLCAGAVPLSMLGFSRLIAVIYPTFGYLGLFLIIVILLTGIFKPECFSKAVFPGGGRETGS